MKQEKMTRRDNDKAICVNDKRTYLMTVKAN